MPLQLATVRIGPAMRDQAGEDVMAVLPDRLGDDERRVGGNVAEDFHAVLLAVDEAVAFLLVEGMGALDRAAFLSMAAVRSFSRASWAAWHFWLAEARRSPLATR